MATLKATLLSAISTLFASNGAGGITAAGLRSVTSDMVNASFELAALNRKTGALTPHENLIIKYVSATSVDVDADAVVLFDTNGVPKRFAALNETVAITTAGVNGLDTGSEASGTWYYIHGVGKDDGTLDCVLSTSATSPTKPAGYDYWGLLGAVRNDGSSNFVRFLQRDRAVTRPAEIVVTSGAQTNYTAISLTAVVPVECREVDVDLVALSNSGTNIVFAFIAPHGSSTTSTYGGDVSQSGSLDGNGMRIHGRIVHLGGHEIYYRAAGTNGRANVWITGWVW